MLRYIERGKRGWGAIMVRQEEVPARRSLRVLYIALYTELCGVPSTRVISIIAGEGELACRPSNGTAKVAKCHLTTKSSRILQNFTYFLVWPPIVPLPKV